MTDGPESGKLSAMTIPEDVLTYLQKREKARQDEFAQLMSALTPKEQSLVREAAVMGFVQGSMAAGGLPRERFPSDTEITQRVVEGCQNFPDLYSTISGL